MCARLKHGQTPLASETILRTRTPSASSTSRGQGASKSQLSPNSATYPHWSNSLPHRGRGRLAAAGSGSHCGPRPEGGESLCLDFALLSDVRGRRRFGDGGTHLSRSLEEAVCLKIRKRIRGMVRCYWLERLTSKEIVDKFT